MSKSRFAPEAKVKAVEEFLNRIKSLSIKQENCLLAANKLYEIGF